MNRTIVVMLGILSGLTWALDIQILSVITASPIIITLFHDFGAFLVNLGSLKKLRFNKMLSLGYIVGTLGTVGFVGASIYGGPMVGAVVSTLMPLITYLLYKRYDKVKTAGYLVSSLLLWSLSSYSGSTNLLGGVLGLLCALGWSLETIILNRYSDGIDAGALVLGRMVVGCLVLLPISVVVAITSNASIDLATLRYAMLAGSVGGISYKLWYLAIVNLNPALANSLNLTYLLFTILFTVRGSKLYIMLSIGIVYLGVLAIINKHEEVEP